MALKCDVDDCEKIAAVYVKQDDRYFMVCDEHSSGAEIVRAVDPQSHYLDDYAKYVRSLPEHEEAPTFAEWKRTKFRPTNQR